MKQTSPWIKTVAKKKTIDNNRQGLNYNQKYKLENDFLVFNRVNLNYYYLPSKYSNHLSFPVSSLLTESRMRPQLALRQTNGVLHFRDQRSQGQKWLTQELCTLLTQKNVNRVSRLSTEPSTGSNNAPTQQFLYVLLPGIPPFQNEFDFLQFPQNTSNRINYIYHPMKAFETYYTEEEIMDLLDKTPNTFTMDYQIQLLNTQIQKAWTKDQQYHRNNVSHPKYKKRPLIFLYHSFGTYLLAYYLAKYHRFQQNPNGEGDQVAGLVEIGPGPIRYYSILRTIVLQLDQIVSGRIKAHNKSGQSGIKSANQSQQSLSQSIYPSQPSFYWPSLWDIKSNLSVYHKRLQSNSQYFTTMHHGHSLAFLSYIISIDVARLFDMTRYMLPQVVRCIIGGSRDSIFGGELIAERMMWYCYRLQSGRKNKQIKGNNNLQKDNSDKPKYNNNSPKVKQKNNCDKNANNISPIITNNSINNNITNKYIQTNNLLNQSDFIYYIQNANHSLHIQIRHQQLIRQAVWEYLSIISKKQLIKLVVKK